jgi:hypothetical protein
MKFTGEPLAICAPAFNDSGRPTPTRAQSDADIA